MLASRSVRIKAAIPIVVCGVEYIYSYTICASFAVYCVTTVMQHNNILQTYILYTE